MTNISLVDLPKPDFAKLVQDELIKRALSVFLCGLVALITLAYALRPQFGPEVYIGYVLAVALAICWFASALRLRHSYRRSFFPKVGFQYHVVRKELIYEIKERGHLQFTRKLQIRSRVDQLDSIDGRTRWSGGDISLPNPKIGCSSPTIKKNYGGWVMYSVPFYPSLNKGKSKKIELHWDPIENWRSSDPHLSFSVTEPSKEIIMEVRIPQGYLKNPTAALEHLATAPALHAYHSEEVEFIDGVAKVTVKPNLYSTYRLSWEWSDRVHEEREALDLKEESTLPSGDPANTTTELQKEPK